MPVPPIGIDLGFGDALQAIEQLRSRIQDTRDSVWMDLRDQLLMLVVAVNALEDTYDQLLIDIEGLALTGDFDRERARELVLLCHRYIHSNALIGEVEVIKGVIQAVAWDKRLWGLTHRTTVSNMRSLYNRVDSYLDFNSFEATELRRGHDDQSVWDLRLVSDLLEKMITAETPDLGELRHACEEAIRNHDRDLAHDLRVLAGRTRQDIQLSRL